MCLFYFVLYSVGKQNSSALESEPSGLLATKNDGDKIALQEIPKDDCDSAESDTSMDFEGI